jgi:NifB/MoaA-like Fe-S oxidoreductase
MEEEEESPAPVEKAIPLPPPKVEEVDAEVEAEIEALRKKLMREKKRKQLEDELKKLADEE